MASRKPKKAAIFDEMLTELENNVNQILNPKTAVCEEWQGCMFQNVCERDTSNCALILSFQHKPLPPACQALVDEDERRIQQDMDNDVIEKIEYTGNLIPCPKCGSKTEMIRIDNMVFGEHFNAYCSKKCGYEVDSHVYESSESATVGWNKGIL